MFSIDLAATAEALFAATISSRDKLQAISDSALSRGVTLYQKEDYSAAVKEFRISISLTPDSSTAPDAVKYLASSYVKLDNVDQAVSEYQAYLKLNPYSGSTLINLGNLLYAEDRYDEAIAEYEKAVKLDPSVNNYLGEVLSRYVYKVDTPKIEFAYSESTFPFYLSMNTPVSLLDSSLSSAGAYKIFSMKFQFDKALDRESVENPANWEISRADGAAPALYNFGLEISETETQLPFIPDYVVYDALNLTATVFFRVYQNETADATIDPGHIEFRYKGKDSYGLSMDPSKDQFTGFSGIF
ncbi:MAG: tetratricopeptide repeat protein [Deltaproteobacteria bacterium]|nr:tetratricopeptide repeat protein [Deltaproteobacteria bacterium]